MNSEIYIKGIVTVNFEMAIDRKNFANACTEFGLNPDNYQDFTETNWVAIRTKLANEVYFKPNDIEIVTACEETVMVDKVEFLDTEHYEVMYTTHGDGVLSIEKDCESLTVKL
jgi:hypothetical protein